MTLRNRLSGWAFYRELRQQPAPIPKRRHGNYRHGGFAREGRASLATFRLWARVLRSGLRHMPSPEMHPSLSEGWRCYRERTDVRAAASDTRLTLSTHDWTA
jgi:hypothetical protein